MSEIRGFDAFDEINKLIIIAAHPDDLESLCGGSVYKLAQRGVEIYSVNCTLGDIGSQDTSYSRRTLGRVRIAETEAAANILGIKQTYNLRQPDGELLPSLALRGQIARLYRLTGADTLWTFDPYWTGQIHPDHRAAGQAALDAYMPSKMPLYRSEQLSEAGADLGKLERVFLFSPSEPDIYVDVSDVYEVKIEGCAAHKSQFPQGADDLKWMMEMQAKQGEVIDAPYAEVFHQMEVW